MARIISRSFRIMTARMFLPKVVDIIKQYVDVMNKETWLKE
jgi:hypothetical protein